MAAPEERQGLSVLRRKREATRYRILVEIAARQPAVSQREIADAIGITAQAVSEYVSELIEEGRVRKEGRSRYEVTKEGVDWLISRTDELRQFTDYVSEEVVERVDLDAAIAAAPVEAGRTVALSMRDGVLRATPGEDGATAVAVDDADADEAVGVTEFEGLLEYEPGDVTILTVPSVAQVDHPSPDPAAVTEHAAAADLVAVAGTEAIALARRAGVDPDIRFGTAAAVEEAAARGLSVLLVAVTSAVAGHTDRLREQNLDYEVLDLANGA
ncbi:MAG: winged helix-turn-helix transcriptional regulator [Halobacteriales archaeon]